MRGDTRFSSRQIAFAGLLGAVTVVLGSTPLGFIQIPPISITIMHIPTILAGVMEGPVIGGIVGAMFGGFSMWQAQTSINPMDKLIFSNPLIAVLPRILIGVTAHYVFQLVRGRNGEKALVLVSSAMVGYTGHTFLSSLAPAARFVVALMIAVAAGFVVYVVEKKSGHGPALAAIAGSLTNTVLVLGLIVAFGFLPGKVALTVGIVNGIPEAAAAMILTGLVYRATSRFVEHR
ncbi:MAG TPA: ECF transporter S component [Firmicutes bacterium]|nr:ECF transporter S component [Candidatus Fermentithermobacillaceae bacterium]